MRRTCSSTFFFLSSFRFMQRLGKAHLQSLRLCYLRAKLLAFQLSKLFQLLLRFRVRANRKRCVSSQLLRIHSLISFLQQYNTVFNIMSTPCTSFFSFFVSREH